MLINLAQTRTEQEYEQINDIFNIVSDGLHKAYFCINEDGTISSCNNIAREIFGAVVPSHKSHPAGVIETGDIVILADSGMGVDDNLGVEDLKYLNIYDSAIEEGNAVLAIGVYNNNEVAPAYKYFKNHIYESNAMLEEIYMGFHLKAAIDFAKRQITISVNDDEYIMIYMEAVANMVVLDGTTGLIKFFQARGFTLRGEEVGNLLRGSRFRGKNTEDGLSEMLPVIGAPMNEIFFGDEFIHAAQALLKQGHGTFVEQIFRINNFILHCQLIRIKAGSQWDGIFAFMQDDDIVKNVMNSANALISRIEATRKKHENLAMRTESAHLSEFIGNSPKMLEVKQLAVRASKGNFNVIITGESGTGKSKLAKEIHRLHDSRAPFVEVTCNAIAPTLIESSLFGYVGGAFTGASAAGKAGFFEEANGGTIFLDEIGEVPLDIQVKLLQVLQTKRIYRVGSTRPIDVDVRVIAATNRNLEQDVIKGLFRQDLFYRINVFPINIPPLRERKRDMYILANNILDKYTRMYGMDEKHFSEEALNAMMTYDWPGNVRELENVVERAIVVCDGPLIYSEHLVIPSDTKHIPSLKEKLEVEEKRIIMETLYKNNWDKEKTMDELKIGRSSFYGKIKKYGIV